MSAAEQLILVAEDDDDDRSLIQHAFKALSVPNPVRFVGDGVELLDYLHRRGAFTDRGANPAPALVFLDLNMPRLDGCATLDAIRHDPAWRRLPVIILTTSSDQDDIDRCYAAGANSYVTKPLDYGGLLSATRSLGSFWLETARLPREPR